MRKFTTVMRHPDHWCPGYPVDITSPRYAGESITVDLDDYIPAKGCRQRAFRVLDYPASPILHGRVCEHNIVIGD